jgi:hypothetical protein
VSAVKADTPLPPVMLSPTPKLGNARRAYATRFCRPELIRLHETMTPRRPREGREVARLAARLGEGDRDPTVGSDDPDAEARWNVASSDLSMGISLARHQLSRSLGCGVERTPSQRGRCRGRQRGRRGGGVVVETGGRLSRLVVGRTRHHPHRRRRLATQRRQLRRKSRHRIPDWHRGQYDRTGRRCYDGAVRITRGSPSHSGATPSDRAA